MIPQIIHYCWFGKTEKSETILHYLSSWIKYFPDYQIVEWNETNFDINICQYTREAYGARKYAFVSDYVRLYALYYVGGIYFDTDIEVCQKLDSILEDRKMVLGFEDQHFIMTAFMAAEPKQECFCKLLDQYNHKQFLLDNGKYDTLPNPVIVTEMMKSFGVVANGNHQVYADKCEIYPSDYFSAFDIIMHRVTKTENTYLIHHCMGTWQTRRDKIKPFIKKLLVRCLGVDFFEKLKLKVYKKSDG